MASQDMFDPTTYTKQLYEQAGAFEVDSSIPVKRYYRSGTEMERQVSLVQVDIEKIDALQLAVTLNLNLILTLYELNDIYLYTYILAYTFS